jgi:citrate lyase subunit alpha/citrate CoA-transferase
VRKNALGLGNFLLHSEGRRREDLLKSARAAPLPVKDIRALKSEVEKLTAVPDLPEFDRSRVVAVVENRDGSLLDSVYKVK